MTEKQKKVTLTFDLEEKRNYLMENHNKQNREKQKRIQKQKLMIKE